MSPVLRTDPQASARRRSRTGMTSNCKAHKCEQCGGWRAPGHGLPKEPCSCPCHQRKAVQQ